MIHNIADNGHANESLKAAEAECAEGRTAPRISLQTMEDAIESVHYTTADRAFGSAPVAETRHATLCMIRMRNGFMVFGHSAPMSVGNFDPELGKKLAYEQCIRQLWPLMAFATKDATKTTPAPESGSMHRGSAQHYD